MKRALIAACLLAAPLAADEVFLKGGGRLKGIVVERTDSRVVVDVGAGRVGLPLDRVDRIVAGRTALSSYLERAERLAGDDVQGWLELALWARERDLKTQAREAFERVVGLDPDNATAQRGLDRVLVAGAWVSQEDAYRARGYVSFEGSWVSPAEREAILAQRRDDAAAERSRAEADALVVGDGGAVAPGRPRARARRGWGPGRRRRHPAGVDGVGLAGGGCAAWPHPHALPPLVPPARARAPLRAPRGATRAAAGAGPPQGRIGRNAAATGTRLTFA
jgi:hypothetical protein